LHAQRSRLAYALDYPDLNSAREGAELVRDSAGVLKVGLELFVKEGPAAVAVMSAIGCEVFLDLKLHDIPATVERAVASACGHGAKYLTVHGAGGAKMLQAAAARAEKEGTGLKLLAVTVLTSLDADDLRAIGVDASPADQVLRLARLAVDCGVHGLVSSAAEVKSLRAALGPSPILVTPGIRLPSGDVGDQKRVGTPQDAISDGSSILVVGRPIRDAHDPAAAARDLADAIGAAVTATTT
jgi:orotidine-5'-phosphate decarboxylase